MRICSTRVSTTAKRALPRAGARETRRARGVGLPVGLPVFVVRNEEQPTLSDGEAGHISWLMYYVLRAFVRLGLRTPVGLLFE
jgi:hypothetical protein